MLSLYCKGVWHVQHFGVTDCDSVHCQSDQWDSLYSIYSGAPSQNLFGWSGIRGSTARCALGSGVSLLPLLQDLSGREKFSKSTMLNLWLFISLAELESQDDIFGHLTPAESMPHASISLVGNNFYTSRLALHPSFLFCDHHSPQLSFLDRLALAPPVPGSTSLHLLSIASCIPELSPPWSRQLVLWRIFKTRLERLSTGASA